MKTYKPFRIEIWLEGLGAPRNGGVFFTWCKALQVLELYPYRSLRVETFYDRRLGQVVQVYVGRPKKMLLTCSELLQDFQQLSEYGKQVAARDRVKSVEEAVVDAGFDPAKLIGQHVHVDFQPTEEKLMRITRRTLEGQAQMLVEGIWLSTEAIRKAYDVLEAGPTYPQFFAGQVVTHHEYRGQKFIVVGAFLNKALNGFYHLSVPEDKVRITDGKTTYTVLRTDLVVVRSAI